MFVNVSVGRGTTNASPHAPSLNDCCDILSMLNQGLFFPRDLPQGNILKKVEQVKVQVAKQTRYLSCHTVAKGVAKEFSSWKWERVPGYLIRSSIDISFVKQLSTYRNPPYFNIDNQTGQVVTWLHHHSVVIDSVGNLIECLPDSYPVTEFVFISHPSGSQGYFLHAI